MAPVAADASPAPLLEVENLRITFRKRKEAVEAVRGISFSVAEGETIAIVGESGSGKSVSCLSLTKLLPDPPQCDVTGAIRLDGRDVLRLSGRDLRRIRGKEIAYIFQEASASLNPVFTVGFQICEAIKLHLPDEADPKARAIAMMDSVGIRDAAKRYKAYPHELSGGMQQRIMIAMALACEPRILVADEPTTALDVTIQAQIMDLLRKIRADQKTSIILITHNFGIVKGFADRVFVMFRGNIVEHGKTDEILENPQHPYTQALLDCIPKLGQKRHRLTTIDPEAAAQWT